MVVAFFWAPVRGDVVISRPVELPMDDTHRQYHPLAGLVRAPQQKIQMIQTVNRNIAASS